MNFNLGVPRLCFIKFKRINVRKLGMKTRGRLILGAQTLFEILNITIILIKLKHFYLRFYYIFKIPPKLFPTFVYKRHFLQ